MLWLVTFSSFFSSSSSWCLLPLRALEAAPILFKALFPLDETLVFAFLRAESVDCLDRFGVVIRFSTELLLSLSVG